MIVKAWNNGAHNRNGAGYGFRVSIPDRDEHFKPEWTSILVELPGLDESVEIQIDKDIFWSETSHELINPEIGKWLRHNGLAPWPIGNPPFLVLEPTEGNHFRMEKMHKQGGKL